MTIKPKPFLGMAEKTHHRR